MVVIDIVKVYFDMKTFNRYIQEEEWANLQGMTHSEIKKHNRLKRKEFNKNSDQQKRENKEK